MSKHTPGPWKTCGASAGRCSCGLIWSEPADCIVAMLSDDEESPPITSDEAVANATLIGAAPDMLAALDALNALFDFSDEVPSKTAFTFDDASEVNATFAKAKAAMRKAKGES